MPVRTLTHEGVTLTINQWAKRLGLVHQVLRYRLDAGWPLDKVLSPDKRGKSFEMKAIGLQRDFDQLVNATDRALRKFQRRIQWLNESGNYTPGVGSALIESPNDRGNRTVPDRL